MRSIKYIINHKLLEISPEAQKSPLLRRAVSLRCNLQPNRKNVKWQWQKQIECSAAGATFFQISRQNYILNFNIFLLNFSVSGQKLKNLRGYYEEQFHYVVPEQKNR